MTNDVETLLIVNLSDSVRAIRLESIAEAELARCHLLQRKTISPDVHGVAFLVPQGRAVYVTLPGLDSPTVDNDRRSVVASSRHRAAWHVLVTSRDCNIAVVVLSLFMPMRQTAETELYTARTVTTISMESAMMSRLGSLRRASV